MTPEETFEAQAALLRTIWGEDTTSAARAVGALNVACSLCKIPTHPEHAEALDLVTRLSDLYDRARDEFGATRH